MWLWHGSTGWAGWIAMVLGMVVFLGHSGNVFGVRQRLDVLRTARASRETARDDRS